MAPTFCSRCGDAVEEGCDLRDELGELDALLERLKLKRYDLTRKINQLYSPIVHHLSPDVTSTIFEFCLPDFTDHQLSPDTKEDISIPLSLGAICSYWRDIAWSTPSLWSSLVVRVTSKHDTYIVTGIAQEWLARSGQLPLSIRIYSQVYEHKAIPALADIVNQYSPRWSDLDLYIHPSYYQHFHATDNYAPILKSIRFYCSAAYGDIQDLNVQLTCPRLERANLSHYYRMAETNIQWDNLTHLTLHSMCNNDSLFILRNTPRLVFCKVSGYCPGYNSSSIGELVLTSLRSLQLTTDYAEAFLNNLIAPHLEEFSLPSFCYKPPMTFIRLVTFFLRRSACSLRSFSMIFSNIPPYIESFMDLLQRMPSLNTLSMISKNITPADCDPGEILQLVAKVLSSQSTSQQGFLPNLKILEYTGMLHLRPGNYDDLYPLPPADNTVHRPFHLLKLNLDQYPIPKNMISYISILEGQGLTVKFKSKDNLQSSVDYFRNKEESLCRDWADNLDSSLLS